MPTVSTMIDVDEALAIVRSCVTAGPTEVVGLRDALFRTLAEPIRCDVDYPPFDRSVMDGYAVRATDTNAAPVTHRLAGQIPAGASPDRTLQPGETMQINTGAPIPPGADAVVRVEETELADDGGSVLIRTVAPAGQFITPRATYVSAGDVVLEPGTFLTPAGIGTAASAGAARLSVFRRPRVAILATGDELVDIDRMPTGGQIRNSNEYLLEALVRSARAEPIALGVAGDDRADLRANIELGVKYDILCITGGVSLGAFDFVPEVLSSCDVTTQFRKMAIKPGRPMIFGVGPSGTPVFALPGNPASALVGFELLVRAAIALRQGARHVSLRFMNATLRGHIAATRDRRTFVPGRAGVGESGEWSVEPTHWHGSGDAFGLASANALIVRPPKAPAAERRDRVSILRLPSV